MLTCSHLNVLLLVGIGPIVQEPGQGEAEATQDKEHADHEEADEVGVSGVQDKANNGRSDQGGDSHTEVDCTEEVVDVLVDEADQDHHAGHLGAEPDTE